MCRRRSGIAHTRPRTVVIKAVEIPPAISFGSPVPKRVIDWNVAIIPVTVPSRPSRGATADKILITGILFS